MELITIIGGDRSNSFITVAEADAILGEHTLLDTSSWDGLSDGEKSERLVYAGLILKNRYSWLHWPVYKNQGMPFPRWHLDDDGNTVYVGSTGQPGIPEGIKKAQALIALNVVHRASVHLTAPSRGKAGPLIRRLSLFNSLDVTVADTPTASTDQSSLGRVTDSPNWMIEELVREYAAQACFYLDDTDRSPEPLDEVKV
ncbi:MAG: DnaT-like ssDNA-binding protein [Thermodesulfobacteriota bacterium]